MNNFTVHIYKDIKNIENIEKIHAIRREVFIDEQKVPEDLEMDGKDDMCVHITIETKDKVIATTRIIQKDEKYYVGRVAVLKDFRQQNLGKKVMEETHKYLVSQNIKTVYLNAQIQVVDFYKKLGYTTISDEFIEAGIIHIEMKKNLN